MLRGVEGVTYRIASLHSGLGPSLNGGSLTFIRSARPIIEKYRIGPVINIVG